MFGNFVFSSYLCNVKLKDIGGNNMNRQEALEKLACYGKAKLQKEVNEANEKLREYEALKSKIEGLFDRIIDLYYIVDKTAELRIKNASLFTDGIDHNLGFYVEDFVIGFLLCDKNACYKPSFKFGIKGGGCDGGDIEINPFERTIDYSRPDYLSFNSISKLKKIVKDFDAYEKKVYDFVENLKA